MQTVYYRDRTGSALPINIHWYDEAEQLIAQLAWRYKDDVTQVYRGGKKRNGLAYYNQPCAYDIETTTIRPGVMDYENADGRPVAFPYLHQFCIYGTVIMCRTMDEAADIFYWLSEYFIGKKQRCLIIYDHNLGYEYGFMKDLWQINGKKSFALDEHHPVTLQLEGGLQLRDSYKMTNMSLETLTKDWSKTYIKLPEIMDYRQLRTPYTTLDDDTLLYSALDVLSLCDAIVQFLQARGEQIWTKCPTSTSFIRAELKRRVGVGVKARTREQQRYFRVLDRVKVNSDIYAYLTRQARGGNTHANRRITGQVVGDPDTGSGVGHWDITSSYPAQMICYPEYPLEEWQPLNEDCPISTIELFERNGYCTLFDLVLINPRIKDGVTVPYIATAKSQILQGFTEYTDNGRYLRGASMLKLTLYGIEWPIIKDQYDFDDTVILGGYFARKGYLPDIVRRYVLELYAKKTELKGVAGSEIEYALAKTYVNGCFGMAFTRILREQFEVTDSGIEKTAAPDPEEELEKYQRRTSYFLSYAWGSMVATLGRVYLQKMIDCAGPYFLYCDTDSVFASHPEIVRPRMQALERQLCEYQRGCGMELTYYDIKDRPHELGGIDEEPECAFKTFGAKKYATIEGDLQLRSTIAGVPKAAGARIIGSSLDGFRLDMTFSGEETNKLALWYNENDGIVIHDNGRPIRIYSNVAMLPVDYYLSLSDDYSICLMMEGINTAYSFKQANINQVEDYI